MSGHNDGTMISLAILGVWLHLRGWKSTAVVAFTLSALVKFLTGMLVPLYILMVLRTLPDWKSRVRFCVKTAAAVSVAVAAVVLLARVKSDLPAAPYATASDFYTNNFHELIFKGLRRALGEDAESVDVPVYFGSWWLVTEPHAEIRSQPDDDAPVLTEITKPRRLLVTAPHLDEWLRIYDPSTRKRGFISEEQCADVAPDPQDDTTDPLLDRLESDTADWPSVITANLWIRIVTWGMLAVFGLVAAWKTTDFDRFIFWSATALLVSYYLVVTQIWPWYIMWGLAFGALNAGRAPARFVVLLSACMLSLYVTIGYAVSDDPWVFKYRSLPAVVLPALLFLAYELIPKLSLGRAKAWRPVPEAGV